MMCADMFGTDKMSVCAFGMGFVLIMVSEKRNIKAKTKNI